MHRLIALVALIGCFTSAYGQNCGMPIINPDLSIGARTPFEHIVGGGVAVPGSWPWQIILKRNGNFLCGGSIIAPGWVLTAGHCVSGQQNNAHQFTVGAGIHNYNCANATCMTQVNVQRIILHNQYNGNTVDYDHALLHLSTDLNYGNMIQPICLPNSDAGVIVATNTAWTTGWGTTASNGNTSPTLRQVQVPFVTTATCNQQYGAGSITARMLCAGRAGKDACQGDSGGPFVRQGTNGRWYLYGVTSWGNGCALANYAGVYARVTQFCTWIQTNSNVACIA